MSAAPVAGSVHDSARDSTCPSPAPGPAVPRGPRRRPGRDFGLLWLGEGVSLLGNATTGVLMPLIAVFSFGAGPGWMGLLTACAWLPWLVFGLPAGAWVDVLPPRAVMIVSDLVAAAATASVPISAALGQLTLVQLLVVTLINGICTVFFRSAYPLLVRGVVPADQRERAFARLFGTESATQVAGPGVAAGLTQTVGSAAGLVLDAASYLVSALCLARLRATPPERPQQAPEPLTARIGAGVRYLRRDRYLRYFTVMGGVSNFGLTGYTALLVLYLARNLELSPGPIAGLLAAGAVGGFVGAAVAPRVSARLGSARATVVLGVVGGPPALLIATPAGRYSAGLVLIGLLGVGIAVVAANVIRTAWRTSYVPETMMARQIATAQLVNFGTVPLAGITAGWLGATLGLRATIAVMAGVHLLACLSLLVSPVRGRRELPEPARPV